VPLVERDELAAQRGVEDPRNQHHRGVHLHARVVLHGRQCVKGRGEGLEVRAVGQEVDDAKQVEIGLVRMRRHPVAVDFDECRNSDRALIRGKETERQDCGGDALRQSAARTRIELTHVFSARR